MNYYNIAQMLFEKTGKIMVPSNKNEVSEDKSRIVATAAHLFLARGMLMSDELVNALMNSNLSNAELADYLQFMIGVVDEAYGNHVVYKPFYRNFPREVMEASEAELVINAILHYISGGVIVPETNVNTALVNPIAKTFNMALMDVDNLKIVQLGTEQQFIDIANNLFASKTSISESDKNLLKIVVENMSSLIPTEIPHKENKAIVIATMLRMGIMEHPLYMNISTPTDILRIAAALSDGDVSLKNNSRFISFPRAIRKWMMDMLECMPGSIAEEMLKYRERWLRIGERIHPNAFSADEYERIIDAFDTLRNNEKAIVPFSSKVERAFISRKYDKLIELLSCKPGYFARELNHMFKVFPDKHYDIAVRFAAVAHKVATPVLLQVKAYFDNEQYLNSTGIYFPKGNTQKIFVKEDTPIVEINDEIKNIIIIACTHGLTTQLREKYASEYDEDKKVFIEDGLRSYLIPNTMRSANKALRVVPRGSRMKLGNDGYVRPFIHWMNNNNRIDVDLSVTFLDKEYQYMDTVSYYDLRNEYAVHSGDYTNAPAPNGACEFVDVNIEKARDCGARYAVLTVHAFTEMPFRDIPECFVGYMTISKDEYSKRYNSREHGMIYNIEDVEMKMDISNDGEYVVVCAFDLETNEVIWCDIAGNADKTMRLPNNVETTQRVISFVMQSIVESTRCNMYDLAEMTVKAKGYKMVNSIEEADVVYSIEPMNIEGKENISVFDTNVWQSMV